MDIYDNGGETLDRYTIFLSHASDDYIAADTDGRGFYQHGEGAERGRHLGKKSPIYHYQKNYATNWQKRSKTL